MARGLRLAATVACLLGVAAPAGAQTAQKPVKTFQPATSLDEKSCVFAAAQKLPTIPGLVVTSARTRDVLPVVAASAVISGFASGAEAVAELQRFFGVAAPPDLQVSRDGPLDPEKARPLLEKKLEDRLDGAFYVEIDFRAIGRYGTYNFICAWTGGYNVLALGLGLTN